MRTNQEIKTYTTRDEFESDIDKIARLQLKREKLIAKRNIESQKVLDNYNPQIANFDSEIEALQIKVLPYANANRDRLFGKGKSASCSLAVYGFKKGNKALANISGKSDEIIAKELSDNGRTDCANIVFKLNKDGIKKALKNNDSVVCNSFQYIQTERFFVEAKTDKEIGA